MGRHSFMYGSSLWAKLALAAAIIAMILFIVGYATVSWMVYQTTANSVRVGLWNMDSCAGTACSERAVADSFKTGNTRTIIESRSEKTGLRGFRPGLTQTRLYSHRRWLEA